MSVDNNQQAIPLFAQTARTLSNDLMRVAHHYISGTRDLREIRKVLAKPLRLIKNDYVRCGYFTDPEAWEWVIKKRGDELEIATKAKPGMIPHTDFIFGVPLPAIN